MDHYVFSSTHYLLTRDDELLGLLLLSRVERILETCSSCWRKVVSSSWGRSSSLIKEKSLLSITVTWDPFIQSCCSLLWNKKNSSLGKTLWKIWWNSLSLEKEEEGTLSSVHCFPIFLFDLTKELRCAASFPQMTTGLSVCISCVIEGKRLTSKETTQGDDHRVTETLQSIASKAV